MERFFKKNEPPRGDETEPCRPFDTEGRTDQEHPEAIVRATPVKTRPLFDLEKLRIYREKLRASFKFGLPRRANRRRFARSLRAEPVASNRAARQGAEGNSFARRHNEQRVRAVHVVEVG